MSLASLFVLFVGAVAAFAAIVFAVVVIAVWLTGGIDELNEDPRWFDEEGR